MIIYDLKSSENNQYLIYICLHTIYLHTYLVPASTNICMSPLGHALHVLYTPYKQYKSLHHTHT